MLPADKEYVKGLGYTELVALDSHLHSQGTITHAELVRHSTQVQPLVEEIKLLLEERERFLKEKESLQKDKEYYKREFDDLFKEHEALSHQRDRAIELQEKFSQDLKEALDLNHKLADEVKELQQGAADVVAARAALAEKSSFEKKIHELETLSRDHYQKMIQAEELRKLSEMKALEILKRANTYKRRRDQESSHLSDLVQIVEHRLGLYKQEKSSLDKMLNDNLNETLRSVLRHRMVELISRYKGSKIHIDEFSEVLDAGFSLAQTQFERKYPNEDSSFFDIKEDTEATFGLDEEEEKEALEAWIDEVFPTLTALPSPLPQIEPDTTDDILADPRVETVSQPSSSAPEDQPSNSTLDDRPRSAPEDQPSSSALEDQPSTD